MAEFFNKYMSSRTAAFYIALVISVLSVIAGAVAAVTLSFAGNVYPVLALTIAGLVIFIVLSLAGQDGLGAGGMALCVFAAFLMLVIGVYAYFLDVIQNQAMGASFDILGVEGFFPLVGCAGALLVCSILANILAWIRMKKKPASGGKRA